MESAHALDCAQWQLPLSACSATTARWGYWSQKFHGMGRLIEELYLYITCLNDQVLDLGSLAGLTSRTLGSGTIYPWLRYNSSHSCLPQTFAIRAVSL